MAVVKCPECGGKVSTTAKGCPHCGAETPTEESRSSGVSVFTVVVVVLAGWLLWSVFASGSSPSIGGGTRDVTYVVEGSASAASLTYSNAQGGTQQEADVSLPWRKSMRVGSGEFLYISAQNSGESGNVVVRIQVDGDQFKRSEATGAYSIASADGSCP